MKIKWVKRDAWLSTPGFLSFTSNDRQTILNLMVPLVAMSVKKKKIIFEGITRFVYYRSPNFRDDIGYSTHISIWVLGFGFSFHKRRKG